MKKEENTKESTKTTIEGATKKCPYCQEELPEKIAFCLYCMKPLTEEATQKFNGTAQENEKKDIQKKPRKILLGAAAILFVVAIVATTSIITASILSRQSIGAPHQTQTQQEQPEVIPPATTPATSQDDTTVDSVSDQQTTPEPVQPEPTPSEPVETSADATTTTDHITIPATITPRPPAQSGGPADPPIPAQEAVALARDHLISIGVTTARFDYIYMDLENGVWVWSLEFDRQGSSYEFYVDVNTGHFLKAPGGTDSGSTVQSPPASDTGNATQAPPAGSDTAGSNNNQQETGSTITLERAIEIAYADIAARGINASFRSDSGLSWERGQWVWELLFATQGERMPLIEYYINAENGNIVKFEWDD